MMMYQRKLSTKVIRKKQEILARKVIQMKITTRVTVKATVAMITHDISVKEVLQNSDILSFPSNLEQLINWPLRKIMKQRCSLGCVTTETAILVDMFRNLTNIITFIFPPQSLVTTLLLHCSSQQLTYLLDGRDPILMILLHMPQLILNSTEKKCMSIIPCKALRL